MSDRDNTNGPTKSPKSAAERMRHYRERKKWGVELHQIEVTQEAKTCLIKRGWLNEVEAQDRKSVRLYVEGLQEGHVHELHMDGLRSAAGKALLHKEAYYTLNAIPQK